MVIADLPFGVVDWHQVADGAAPHRSRTRKGAKLHVID